MTVTRLAENDFLLMTGAGAYWHDRDLLMASLPSDGSITINDVTRNLATLLVTGPSHKQGCQIARNVVYRYRPIGWQACHQQITIMPIGTRTSHQQKVIFGKTCHRHLGQNLAFWRQKARF